MRCGCGLLLGLLTVHQVGVFFGGWATIVCKGRECLTPCTPSFLNSYVMAWGKMDSTQREGGETIADHHCVCLFECEHLCWQLGV